MQVIYKVDRVFIWIYSAIIVLVGVVGFVASGSFWFFLFMLLVESVYLYFALKRPWRRYREVKKGFPAEWRDFFLRYSEFYRNIGEEGQARFETDVLIFLSDFSIQGTRSREMDLHIKLLVASGVAAMVHGRPYWEPPIPDGVVVYPGHTFNRHFEGGRGNFAGMATRNAPLILTEGSLEESFRNPHDGYNVIFHELAHYFDISGESDQLKELIHHEWQKAFRGESYLRSYASQNEAEFFAVAVEGFYERPGEMKARSPELYDALVDFFNLDTAAIIGPDF